MRIARNIVPAIALLCLPVAVAQNPGGDTLVYEHHSNLWFEGPSTRVTVSADGKWALFKYGRSVRLVSLASGKEDRQWLTAGLDSPAEAAVFCGNGLALKGRRGKEYGWFVRGEKKIELPPDAELQCSADGKRIAVYFPSQRVISVFIDAAGKRESYSIAGRVTGAAFTADGKSLYVLAFQPDGQSSLLRIMPPKPGVELVARGLDAPPRDVSIAVSPDGQSVFVPLAGDGKPDDRARHQPDADRWLKIYRIDAASGARQAIAARAQQDSFGPAVADGNLYWTRNLIHDSVSLVPAGGGEAKELVHGGELPVWSPDGRRISYAFGGWRVVDWGLNLDAAVVGVSAQGERTAEPSVIVAGYHEDFPAAWSPDGRWIAYHSHRSATPVPAYDSAGATDDVYVRRADDVHAPEIRVTDFGWETGPAFWSPDGRKLLFSSWVKGGQPGIDKLWVVTLDPQTGRALEHRMLPLPAEIRSVAWAAWSPDGKEIAIEDRREGDARSLWIANSDGTRAQKLLDYQGTTYDGLDWMPDGKTIVYSGLADGRTQLFAVARAGGAPRQLSHDSANLLHPRVSPHGRWIACTRMAMSQQIWKRQLEH